MARVENIITPILIGDASEIIRILNTHNIDISKYEIIDETDKPTACLVAVKLVSSNSGYFLMKGLVDTSIILRAALNKDFGLRTENRISHVSVMEVSTHKKLIYMSDGAMNIAPTLDEKRQIIENSVKIAHAVGNKVPNVGIIGAIEKANDFGMLTAGISCNPDSPLSKIAQHPITPVVGPEFVTGSTRMKSGTAQKLVLNMISTSLMIQLGHVKGNKMVDMQLSNHKLVERGTRMVCEQLNISQELGKELLLKFGSVRSAIDNYENKK